MEFWCLTVMKNDSSCYLLNLFWFLLKAVLQTAPKAHIFGRLFSVVKAAVIGCRKIENKWLSKLQHNHPLFILSLFLSHTACCKRTANVQGSHDSEEHDVSLDEEQHSNEMCNCWASKKSKHTKERRQTYRNMRKKGCFFMLFFLHYFTKRNVYPLTSTMNNWIVFAFEDQKCNRQRDSSGRAWLHIWRPQMQEVNRHKKEEMSRKVRSPLHSQVWLYNINTFSSAVRINTCLKFTYSFVTSKKRLSHSRAFFIKSNAKEHLQANVRQTL